MKRRLLLSSLVLAASACGGSTPPPESAPPPPAADAAPAAPADAGVAATSSPAPAASASPPAHEPAVVAHVDVPPSIAAVVAAADRSEADKKLDAGRRPAEMLAFFGIAPGMHVAEIASGGGYTTELLARAVGSSGVVYGENPKFILDRFAAKPWAARLAKTADKNVVRSDREPADPFPPDAHDLDAVIDVLFYHDLVWLGVDRSAMNAAIFKALKPGGVYGIVDHAAKSGSGTSDVKTLHRIDPQVVRDEIEHAGFRLEKIGTFLANPKDTHDWNDSPMQAGDKRGTSDRFVYEFVKP